MEMPTIARGRALAYVAAIVLVLVVGGRFLLDRATEAGAGAPALALTPHPDNAIAQQPAGPDAAAGNTTGSPEVGQRLVVHVAGAVRRPGVYLLAAGARVDDAIREAGGALRKAQLDALNLAQPVVDGQQVLVPRRGVAAAAAAVGPSTVPPAPISLTTASAEDLDALPGVGPVTAQRILDYRAQHGGFGSVDELDAVPGIGPARLEQLRELVVP